MSEAIKQRLEYLRQQLDSECISWLEINELQGLAKHIDQGDVQLLEAAGVPEHPCRYCGGHCEDQEEFACDGYLGDVDGLYEVHDEVQS
jgi:hypothetical protein